LKAEGEVYQIEGAFLGELKKRRLLHIQVPAKKEAATRCEESEGVNFARSL